MKLDGPRPRPRGWLQCFALMVLVVFLSGTLYRLRHSIDTAAAAAAATTTSAIVLHLDAAHSNATTPLPPPPPNYSSSSSSSLAAWSSPGMFHVSADGTRVDGSISVQYKSRTNVFNLDDTSMWHQGKEHSFEVYELVSGCEYCFNGEDDAECVTGRLMAFKPYGDVKGPIPAGIARVVRDRQYTEHLASYPVKFRPIFLQCRLSAPLPADTTTPGRLLLFSRKLHWKVNAWRRTTPADNHQPEDVVCGRGIFGQNVDPVAIARYVDYYHYKWKFHRVIAYDIGYHQFARHDALREHIAAGRLVVIDVTSELERLYGPNVWRDVVLMTSSIFQVELKFDCITRASALGARWTLHTDMDEYLFESTPPPTRSSSSSFPDFNAYAERKWGNTTAHVGFAVQTIKHNRSRLCQPSSSSAAFDWQQFNREEHASHALEVKEQPGLPGPFFHNSEGSMSAQRGKRKVLVRLDLVKFNPWHLGIHIVRPCAFTSQDGARCLSLDAIGKPKANPLREGYLREFSCANGWIQPHPHASLRGEGNESAAIPAVEWWARR